MRTDFHILKSKIAKRLLVLCLTIVIIPLGFTALLSNFEISTLLTKDQSALMREASKGYGLDIFERLFNAQNQLKLLANSEQIESSEPNQKQGLYTDYFSDISSQKTNNKPENIASNLNKESPTLLVRNNSSGVDFYLVEESTKNGSSITYYGKLKEDYLWSDTYLQVNYEVCVYSVSIYLLHCSNSIPKINKEDVYNISKNFTSWENEEGVEMLSSSWQLFMGHQFNTDDWVILTSRPENIVFSSLYDFQRLLILGISLTLLLSIYTVIFFIKKHLRPVNALIEGTKEITANNLNFKVNINSNDEYEELADSFNNMVGKLSSESLISSALSEIDQKLIVRSDLDSFIGNIVESITLLTQPEATYMLVSEKIVETHYYAYRYDYSNEKLHKEVILSGNPCTNFNDIELGAPACFTFDQLKSRIISPYLSSNHRYTLFQLSNDCDLQVLLIIANCNNSYHPRANEFFQHCSIVLKALHRDKLLEAQANTDNLTKLANRKHFQETISTILQENEANLEMASLLFIDLDKFKNVNDTLGHHFGDILLQQASIRLNNALPDDALLARFGGDEFTIFVPKTTRQSLEVLASTVITTLSDSYFLDGYCANVSASIGISIFPDDGTNFDELLQCSDLAMYAAKNAGRDRYSFYTEKLSNQLNHRVQLESYISDVLKNNQLEVYFQPKVSLSTSKISGFEALSRFKHPEHGFLSPFTIYEIAEDTGHVLELGYYVLLESMKQQVAWEKTGLWSGKMAINVSPVQLFDVHFLDRLELCLKTSGANPQNIELEITEGVLIENADIASNLLHKIKSKGINIALDDFGTGYSSLAYITSLPIDNLKIDRAFVIQIDEGKKFRGVLTSIIQMAKHLGVEVTAEGIEVESHAKFLLDAECDYAQGYLYSKPLRAKDAELFLKNHH